jgi:RNA polymerase sigma-B factor
MSPIETTRQCSERRLFDRYHRHADPAARAALVDRFLPLARHLARRYERGGEPLDDLVQVASVGLLNAIDRFDPHRATAFSTFATPTILGELRRHFRDRGWSVRVPRDLQELALRVQRAADELAAETGRPATATALAAYTGATVEKILEARLATGAHRAVSLDGLSGDSEPDGVAIVATLGSGDPGYGQAEDAATLETLMRSLDSRDREILRLRFTEDLTQTEIGGRIGVSQMHVSRRIREALARLQETARET